MSDTTLSTVETGIAVVLAAITAPSGATVKVLTEEPGLEGMSLPAITLYPPRVVRPGVDTPDRMVGRNTWDVTWSLRIYALMDNAVKAQRDLKSILGDVIKRIDASSTLNGTAEEARLVAADSATIVKEAALVAMVYECQLHAYVVV